MARSKSCSYCNSPRRHAAYYLCVDWISSFYMHATVNMEKTCKLTSSDMQSSFLGQYTCNDVIFIVARSLELDVTNVLLKSQHL